MQQDGIDKVLIPRRHYNIEIGLPKNVTNKSESIKKNIYLKLILIINDLKLIYFQIVYDKLYASLLKKRKCISSKTFKNIKAII